MKKESYIDEIIKEDSELKSEITGALNYREDGIRVFAEYDGTLKVELNFEKPDLQKAIQILTDIHNRFNIK